MTMNNTHPADRDSRLARFVPERIRTWYQSITREERERLARMDPDKRAAILEGRTPRGTLPPLWDGHAAERIVEHLHVALEGKVELARTGS